VTADDVCSWWLFFSIFFSLSSKKGAHPFSSFFSSSVLVFFIAYFGP